jgi:hypothetical protein
MSRVGRSSLKWTAALALLAGMAIPGTSRADIVLYDKDGWGFFTRGLINAHYQAIVGDADPTPNAGTLLGSPFAIPDESTSIFSNNGKSLDVSRIRSGFVGTQIGFGATRKLSDSVNVDSFMAVSLDDISNARGQSATINTKDVDFREAWAAIHSPYGTFKFGRMFSIFGSASAEVMLIAFRYGEGNPCLVQAATIGCGSVGAGPLYAQFDGQFRYISPRLAGFELQLAILDPTAAPDVYTLTPIPRFDGQLSWEAHGPTANLRLVGQGVYNLIQQQSQPGAPEPSAQVWGGMGSALFDVGGAWGTVKFGGGGWYGKGIGTHWIMENPGGGAANFMSFDGSPQHTLRDFLGVYTNLAYDYRGSAIAVGGGGVFVKETAFDQTQAGYDLLTQSEEAHVVFTQTIDTIVLEAEYMRWQSKWQQGDKQNLNFGGVGANFFW